MPPPPPPNPTQPPLLPHSLALPKFPTSHLLPDAVKRGTPLGLQARALMEAGHLVGDDLILGVIRAELAKPEAAQGVIFDGVVRTIPQAEGMASLLADAKRKMTHVLFFEIADSVILDRLVKRKEIEGRADDDPAAVATRLEAYRRQTAPVLAWYQDHCGVTTIDAVGSVDEVAARVRTALSPA